MSRGLSSREGYSSEVGSVPQGSRGGGLGTGWSHREVLLWSFMGRSGQGILRGLGVCPHRDGGAPAPSVSLLSVSGNLGQAALARVLK